MDSFVLLLVGTDITMMVFWDLEQDPHLFEIYATDPDDLRDNFNCVTKPEFFTHNYTEPGDYTITAKYDFNKFSNGS